MLFALLALDGTADAARSLGTSGPDLTRYLLVCTGLIAATAGLGWLFKKLVAGNLRARASKRSLEIMDVLPLGGKQKLAVVRCYDRTFVLGLGDKEVGLIAELDAVIAPARETAPTKADAHGFKAVLDRLRKQTDPQPGAAKVGEARGLSRELFG